MAQSFCTSCGKPLNASARFCGSCGAEVGDIKAAAASSDDKKEIVQSKQDAAATEPEKKKGKFDIRSLLLSFVASGVGFVVVLFGTEPVNLYLWAFATFFPILSFALRKPFDRLFASLHRAKEKMEKEVRVVLALSVPAVAAFASTLLFSDSPAFAMSLSATVGMPVAYTMLRRPASLQKKKEANS